MTRKRGTSGSNDKLWPGVVTLLLLVIGSVSSEGGSALDEALPSLQSGEAIVDSSSGNVAPLRKIDNAVKSPSTTFKYIEKIPEASVESGKVDLLNSLKTASNGSQEDSIGFGKKAEKLRIDELTKPAKNEEKRAINGSLPEISENEENEEIDYLENDDDREPTTKPPKRQVGEEKPAPKDSKHRGKESPGGEKPEVSLANDTNVNYNGKKTVKVSKNELGNSTNVIASGDEALDNEEKLKGPKDQVEVVKNSTLPKILRITEAGDEDIRTNIENVDSEEKSDVEIEDKHSKDLSKDGEKTRNLTVDREIEGEISNDTKALQSPKARTISFGGVNDFVTDDNKTGGTLRENGEIADRTVGEIATGVTREQELKSIDLKPYPYVKTNFQTNSSDDSSIVNARVPEPTGEALENTIGRREQEKKIVVTESSVVIDNSIQQFKPTYYKRAENTTATTESSLEGEGRSETTLGAKSIALDNETTVFVAGSPISNTENDVPSDKATKSSATAKDAISSSGLDLTGNGITEIIAGIKNDSVKAPETSATTASIPSTTKATDEILVQNSTEKAATIDEHVALTSVDVQTDPEESMLKISSLNVTEGFTRIASTLSGSTLIPQSSTNGTLDASIPTVSPKILSTLEADKFLASTVLPESSSLTSIAETSSDSPVSGLNSMSTIPNPSSLLSEPTSPSPPITKIKVTTPDADKFTDELSPNISKSVSSSPDELAESTTSKIEYVFVGLTEATESETQFVASSERPNAATFSELGSSTPSGISESTELLSKLGSTTEATIKDNASSTTSTEKAELSTEPVTFVAETNTSEDSTATESTMESTTVEASTIWNDQDTEINTTIEDNDDDTTTNESVETTTEEFAVTNSNEEAVPDHRNTTDEGRSVASSTNAPIAVGTDGGNSSGTIIASTEATTLEPPTIVPKIMVSNSTTVNPESNVTFQMTSTKPTITVPKTEMPTTLEDSVDIVTDDSIDITNRADFPSLVKVVFEGTWTDVCPHLDALRQSLADLLTSGLEKTILASQIIFQNNPCSGDVSAMEISSESLVTTLLLYVVDENGKFDGEMTRTLPSLYDKSPIKLQVNIRSFQLVQDSDSGNAIAVIVVSCVALICLVLLAGLLFIMRKRQTRFNYGERCRPVSLDAYSLDSVSAYNSVRRKGAARASKRSYGNPTFEDTSAIPSHPLNFAGLSTFCNEQNTISEEFAGIPQVTARIDELPPGAEVKNRYANVVPLPETRVTLMKINNDPLTEYINASYVRGPKNATKYYIACQAPIESTVTDFWRMIWEQQTKVVIMLTDLVENGVEKCAEYIPPSEVTDCHRLYGDFQVTLKKRETKEKYAISTLHLKNLENNTFREISHIWYLWPANGVQTDAAGLIAVLLEARALQRGGPGPIVIHCSPGTGRTGTLIALDLGIRQYEITRTVDVPRVVYTIRRDRAGSVQTKEQYAFIYKALNLYATKLAGGALES